MNRDFRIPKIQKKLQILRAGVSGFHECVVYLSERSRHYNGPETISEFLNDGPAFVPVELDGRVNILNTHHIMAFRDNSERVTGTGRYIQIVLENGRLFTVQLEEQLPESHRRTQDYLNSGALFLEFVSEKFCLYVNREFIISAVDQ